MIKKITFIELSKDDMRLIELMKAGSQITGDELAINSVRFLCGENGVLYYKSLIQEVAK